MPDKRHAITREQYAAWGRKGGKKRSERKSAAAKLRGLKIKLRNELLKKIKEA